MNKKIKKNISNKIAKLVRKELFAEGIEGDEAENIITALEVAWEEATTNTSDEK